MSYAEVPSNLASRLSSSFSRFMAVISYLSYILRGLWLLLLIIIIFVSLQTDRTQYVCNHSRNEWSQVITGKEFTCTAATQGAHHVIHLI